MASVTQRLAAPRRLFIPPFAEPEPRRGRAWIVSLGIHAAVVVALLCFAQKALLIPPARNDRIVFVEPAPAPAPQAPAQKVEPLPESMPQPPPPSRLVAPRKMKPLPPPLSAPTMPPASIPESDHGAIESGSAAAAGGRDGG